MAGSPMELETLLAEYSVIISTEDKDAFVSEHPELKDERVATRALQIARLRYQTRDYQATARYANAAFCLAGDLDDKDMGAEAADVLADACEGTGAQENAAGWRFAAMVLRAGLD